MPAATTFEPRLLTLRDALHDLLQIAPGDHLVISCYVPLDPDDRAAQRYLREVKQLAAALPADPAVQRASPAARLALQRDLERIEEFLAQPLDLPSSRGLALFAGEPLNLFAAVPLPRVYRTRVIVDRAPAIRELAALADAFGRLVVVALDRAHARFFEVTAFGPVELPCLADPGTRGGRYHSDRADAPGWGERDYHHRIQAERERHYDAVARHLRSLDRQGPVHGLVLAGRDEDTKALARFLEPALARRVWHTARINPTAVAAAEILDAARAARDAHDRAIDRETAVLVAQDPATGWVAIGVRETLRALGRGQVRTLLVGAEAAARGFRCSRTGLLTLDVEECGGPSEAIAVADVVGGAVEEALRQEIEVRTLQDPAVAAMAQGLSAVLRFRSAAPPVA
jgi:peptide subunit release factor 1 (eRF1)